MRAMIHSPLFRFLLLGFFIVILTSSDAADYPIAKILPAPGPEYADEARVWQGIPGIERAANGRLWVTWYTGDVGEGATGNYAMVATASDPGKPWSKPMAIVGPPGTRIGDPIPWIDPKGRLWIFYHQLTVKTESTPSIRGTFAIRTDDPTVATPAWSEPFLVASDGILFGKPIIRNDGAWVAPYFINGKPAWSDKVAGKETGSLISTDEGVTWTWLGGCAVPKDLLNFSEATLAERKNGDLWMVIRTLAGLRESTSTDGGLTWSDPIPMPGFETGPSTRACMRKLRSGAFLLVYHNAPANKNGGFGRAQLTAWLSDDEGRTWPHRLLIDGRSGVSYPDATEAADGQIFITHDLGRYKGGEKAILVSALREEDIRAGKVVSSDTSLNVIANRALGYGNHAEIRDEEAIARGLPPKEKLHLYLLIGQSNMAGRGMIEGAEPVSKLRLLKFSPRDAWAPCVDPLHLDKPAIVGVGLGTSFAREMADADPGITVGLIPCAVGGTPLSRWEKGGDLYEQALKSARLAMKDGTIKGILWHQGESDSGAEETAKSYASRLAGMVAALRTDLGAGELPFVAGELGEFLAPVTKEGTPSFWPLVNEQIASLPGLVSNCAVVDSSGLVHKGDVVHFDSASLREFGRRYAKAMEGLRKPE